jgi:hypothetical protein
MNGGRAKQKNGVRESGEDVFWIVIIEVGAILTTSADNVEKKSNCLRERGRVIGWSGWT